MSTAQRFSWTALLLLSMGGLARAENVVGSAGFEGELVAPWQFGALGGAKATVEIDSQVFHGGKRSLRLTNDSAQAPNVFGMVSQTLQVKPNTRYEFSAWCKGAGVGNAWIGGGPGWGLRVRFPAGTYDWQRFMGTFFVGPKETTFDLVMAVESPTEAIWLDDVEVTPVATLEPEEYLVRESSLAKPEAVAAMLRPDLPDAIGVSIFGFPRTPGEFDRLAALGVGLVRMNMHWAEAEPQKGTFDEGYWKLLQQWVDSYNSRGIRVLFILAYGNPAYGGPWGEMAKTPERRAAFARFAAEAASQFKDRKVLFELWNEPDGAVTPEEYAALAKVTIPAMRKAHPSVVVIGPAAHHYAIPWMEQCFQYGLLDLLDAVSIHLYFGTSAQPQPIPELNGPLVEEARKLVAKYADSREVPIINSEWGYNRHIPGLKPEGNDLAVSTRDNAPYLPRAFLLSQLWGLKGNVWFCWCLDAQSIRLDGDYGLLAPDHQATPSYPAMVTLSSQLPRGHFQQRVEVGSQDDYVLQFDTAAGTRWAVWTVGEPHVLQIPVGEWKKMNVTDLTGSRSDSISLDPPGVIRLPADGAVQYLYGE